MVFYKGRAPYGRKTEWKMNEYKVIEEAASSNGATPTVRNHMPSFLYSKNNDEDDVFDRLGKAKIHNQVPNLTCNFSILIYS